MFCPRCGREGKGLCLECYLEGHPLIAERAELLCCNCGSVYYKGAWGLKTEEVIPEIVKNSLVVPEELTDIRLDLDSEIGDKEIKYTVTVRGKYMEEPFERVIPGSIKIRGGNCPSCGKLSSGYYEAILQFRTEKPMDLIEKIVDSSQVSRLEKVKGGVDVYVTSNSYGRKVMNKLRKKGFAVKDSAKLMGQRKGKEYYRVSFSIKDS